MTRQKLKTIILLLFLNILVLLVLILKELKYENNLMYIFICYNKNKVIISSYGHHYNPEKKIVFDAREQRYRILPDDCSVFKE
jgi:hypothetical protein